jgi:hypothetical protein
MSCRAFAASSLLLITAAACSSDSGSPGSTAFDAAAGSGGEVLGTAGATSTGGATSAGGLSVAGMGGTGGIATGGAAAGGTSSGGVGTGGMTGGTSTGGIATGGTSTGGIATGGTSTGGAATGGTSTGGTTGGVAGVGGTDVAGTGGWALGGEAGLAGAAGAAGSAGSDCLGTGNVTYTLDRVESPTQQQQEAYALITEAMDTAVYYYNCYTDITKVLTVHYEPSVATADGNVNGSIRFGAFASMQFVTAMHEIAHTVGIGHPDFAALVVDGIFTGVNATNELRAITADPEAELHADSMHFWPYGLNYESEYETEDDLINHCRMVVAIRQDMGWS